MSTQPAVNRASNQSARSGPLGPSIMRLLLCIAVVLALPLVAMPTTDQVDWRFGDFMLMALLLGAGSAWIVFRRYTTGSVTIVGLVLAVLLAVLLWAELAVGMLFGVGS